jgi:hypothetical protein
MKRAPNYEVRIDVPKAGSTYLWFDFIPQYSDLIVPLLAELQKVQPGVYSDRIHTQVVFVKEMDRRGDDLAIGENALIIAGTFVGKVNVTEYDVWTREPEDIHPPEAFAPAPPIADGRPQLPASDDDIPF